VSAESEKWMQDNGIISGLKDKFQSCWDAATLNVEEKFTSTNTGSPKCYCCGSENVIIKCGSCKERRSQ